MSNNKYNDYNPKHEHYETVLYKKEGQIGELLCFVYENGRCVMNHDYWGSELDYEYNRHGEVEHNYIWDEENTEKMMLRTGSRNGKELVEAIRDRFHIHGALADVKIREWCEEKDIRYSFIC